LAQRELDNETEADRTTKKQLTPQQHYLLKEFHLRTKMNGHKERLNLLT